MYIQLKHLHIKIGPVWILDPLALNSCSVQGFIRLYQESAFKARNSSAFKLLFEKQTKNIQTKKMLQNLYVYMFHNLIFFHFIDV